MIWSFTVFWIKSCTKSPFQLSFHSQHWELLEIAISLFISGVQLQPLRQLPKYWTFFKFSAGIFNSFVWLKNLAVALNVAQILSNSSSRVWHLSLIENFQEPRFPCGTSSFHFSTAFIFTFLWNVLAGVLDSLNVIHEMYFAYWTNSICL